jgi:hypothetical protein
MNEEIGIEATQFPEKEYTNGFRCSVFYGCSVEAFSSYSLADYLCDLPISVRIESNDSLTESK